MLVGALVSHTAFHRKAEGQETSAEEMLKPGQQL